MLMRPLPWLGGRLAERSQLPPSQEKKTPAQVKGCSADKGGPLLPNFSPLTQLFPGEKVWAEQPRGGGGHLDLTWEGPSLFPAAAKPLEGTNWGDGQSA